MTTRSKIHADHEAESPDIADHRVATLEIVKSVPEVFSLLIAVFENALFEFIKDLERGPAGEGVPAECRRVGTGRELFGNRIASDRCANDGAVAESLCHRRDIRCDPKVFHRKHASCPSRAGLYLIGDEDDPVFIANAAQALDVLDGRDEVSAFTLNRLYHKVGNFFGVEETSKGALFEFVQPIEVFVLMGVGIRNVVDVGTHQGAESGPLDNIARGMTECS